MNDVSAFAPDEMVRLAARAMQRIEDHGRRGTSMVTYDEIEAMACVLLLFGFPVLAPADPMTGAAQALVETLNSSAGRTAPQQQPQENPNE